MFSNTNRFFFICWEWIKNKKTKQLSKSRAWTNNRHWWRLHMDETFSNGTKKPQKSLSNYKSFLQIVLVSVLLTQFQYLWRRWNAGEVFFTLTFARHAHLLCNEGVYLYVCLNECETKYSVIFDGFWYFHLLILFKIACYKKARIVYKMFSTNNTDIYMYM